MSEREKISTAIDRFAVAMKKRMLSKAKQGWAGWRCGEYVNDRLLRNAASASLNEDQKSCVDAANFAMMIWLTKENGNV